MEVLVSRKVVYREVYIEGSGTTKFGTDEQERHMRLLNEDKQTQHCNVHKYHLRVDVAVIEGRKMFLPGEVSVTTSWYNREVSRSHSRYSKRVTKEMWMVSLSIEGLNFKSL